MFVDVFDSKKAIKTDLIWFIGDHAQKIYFRGLLHHNKKVLQYEVFGTRKIPSWWIPSDQITSRTSHPGKTPWWTPIQ